jgi:hypothetical protein
MEGWVKSTMARTEDRDPDQPGTWECIEDRIPINRSTEVDKRFRKALIFAQPTRRTDDDVAYMVQMNGEDYECEECLPTSFDYALNASTDPATENEGYVNLEKCERKALNKRQRKIIETGAETCDVLDCAIGANLGFFVAPAKYKKQKPYLAFVPMMAANLLLNLGVEAVCNSSVDPADFSRQVCKAKPELVMNFIDEEQSQRTEWTDHFEMLESWCNGGSTVLFFNHTWSDCWNFAKNVEIPIYHCRGNMSYMTNCSETAEIVRLWSWTTERGTAPKTIDDL